MPRECVDDLSLDRVPQLDGLIPTAGGNTDAIRKPHHARHVANVASKRAENVSRLKVPDLQSKQEAWEGKNGFGRARETMVLSASTDMCDDSGWVFRVQVSNLKAAWIFELCNQSHVPGGVSLSPVTPSNSRLWQYFTKTFMQASRT